MVCKKRQAFEKLERLAPFMFTGILNKALTDFCFPLFSIDRLNPDYLYQKFVRMR